MRRPRRMHARAVDGLHGHGVVAVGVWHAAKVLHGRLVVRGIVGAIVMPVRAVVVEGLVVLMMVVVLVVVHLQLAHVKLRRSDSFALIRAGAGAAVLDDVQCQAGICASASSLVFLGVVW